MTGTERAEGLRGITVPGLLLRPALLGAALSLAALVMAGRDVRFSVVMLLVLLSVGVTVAPGSLLGGVLLGVVIVLELAAGSGDVGARLAATVVAFHLVHVLTALAAVIPAASRVEVAALVPSAIRFVAVEAVVVAVLVAGRHVPADAPPGWVLVVLALAACALAIAPLALLRRP